MPNIPKNPYINMTYLLLKVKNHLIKQGQQRPQKLCSLKSLKIQNHLELLPGIN